MCIFILADYILRYVYIHMNASWHTRLRHYTYEDITAHMQSNCVHICVSVSTSWFVSVLVSASVSAPVSTQGSELLIDILPRLITPSISLSRSRDLGRSLALSLSILLLLSLSLSLPPYHPPFFVFLSIYHNHTRIRTHLLSLPLLFFLSLLVYPSRTFSHSPSLSCSYSSSPTVYVSLLLVRFHFLLLSSHVGPSTSHSSAPTSGFLCICIYTRSHSRSHSRNHLHTHTRKHTHTHLSHTHTHKCSLIDTLVLYTRTHTHKYIPAHIFTYVQPHTQMSGFPAPLTWLGGVYLTADSSLEAKYTFEGQGI